MGITVTPFDRQVGGSHYKDFVIQPAIFCHLNKIPSIESNIIKYVCRWKEKGGREDLAKVRHYLEMLEYLEDHKLEWVEISKPGHSV